ncbi:MAG: hypothetical protein ACOC8H_00040, partial [bacterium]
LKAMEQARLEEIVREAEAARDREDLEALEAVLGELRSRQWVRTKPSRKLIQAVDKLALPFRRREAGRRYEETLTELRTAHGAMDESTCRSLMERWEAIRRELGVGPPGKLADEIEPIQQWLEDLEKSRQEDAAYEKACAALADAVDEQADREVLDKRLADVYRFERGVPEVLAARAQTWMDELKGRARRRFAIIVTSISAAVILIGAGTAFVIHRHARQSALENWQTQIHAELEVGDLSGARSLLTRVESQDPAVYGAPEIQKLNNRLERLEEQKQQQQQEDRKRRERFVAAIEKAEEAGVETPDKTALERAKDLARTDAEKHRVAQVQSGIDRHEQKRRQRLRREWREAVAARMEDMRAQVDEVERAFRYDTGDIEQLYSACTNLAAAIRKMPGFGSSHEAALQSLVGRADTLKTKAERRAERRQEVQQALAKIRRAYNHPKELETALQNFGEAFPDHPLAEEFADAAKQQALWQAATAWRQFIRSRSLTHCTDATKAAERREAVAGYLGEHPDTPCADRLAEYVQYLRTAAGVLADGGLLGRSAVQDTLNERIVSDVFMLTTTDGRRFYLLDDKMPPRTGGRVSGPEGAEWEKWQYRIRHVVDADGRVRETTVDEGKLLKKPAPVPQAELAGVLKRSLTQFDGHGWETLYLELAEKVRAAEEVDSILRAQLIKLLLDNAAACAPFETDAIRRTSKKLEQFYARIDWMDPADTRAEMQRAKATATLDDIGSLEPLARSVKARLEAMVAPLPCYRPVGVLMTGPGEVELLEDVKSGELYVLRDGGEGALEVVSIGHVKAGKAKVDPSRTKPYYRGSPVYIDCNEISESKAAVE